MHGGPVVCQPNYAQIFVKTSLNRLLEIAKIVANHFNKPVCIYDGYGKFENSQTITIKGYRVGVVGTEYAVLSMALQSMKPDVSWILKSMENTEDLSFCDCAPCLWCMPDNAEQQEDNKDTTTTNNGEPQS